MMTISGLTYSAIGITAMGAIASSALGLHFNRSPSLPIGWYIDSRQGELVAVCPAGDWGTLSVSRGYREPSWLSDKCRDAPYRCSNPSLPELVIALPYRHSALQSMANCCRI